MNLVCGSIFLLRGLCGAMCLVCYDWPNRLRFGQCSFVVAFVDGLFIIWAPGCQTIGESHSGDTETLWYDGYRFIRSRARSAFGNYSLPIRFNCLFELGAWGFRGTHRPTCLAASTLSLGVLCGRRGTWAPCIYYVYLVYRE